MSRWGRILVAVLSAVWLSAGCRHAPSWPGLVADSVSVQPAADTDAQPVAQHTFPLRRLPAVVTPGLAQRIAVTGIAERTSVALAAAVAPVPGDAPPPVRSAEALEELPAPEAVPSPDPLALFQVVDSVFQSYPLLRIALLERGIADGKQLAAWGEFDTNLKAFAIEMPQGYYENYRHGVALNQPVFRGGYLFGAYKIGRGDFQPWFKDRQTNEGGEFALGAGLPLLKDRAIDKRRSELFQAQLARQAVEPAIQTELLDYVRVASQIYWSWVAAGQAVDARRDLLRLARDRVRQIDERVAAGDLGEIARITNEQLIAARETKLIEDQRKLEMSAIKLSLFLRTPAGEPIVPDTPLLPEAFPDHSKIVDAQIDRDITSALAARPELVELDLQYRKTSVELTQATNMLLPKLDALVIGSQDVGAPFQADNIKGPFELEAGLYGEVPLQRREAEGKIETARAKLAQIRAKREFVVNKVTAEVQDAVSALRAAEERIERAVINRRLARESLEMARTLFDAGDIDLVELNIYEQATLDAQILLVEAQADYFVAVADYRAALGVDPRQAARM